MKEKALNQYICLKKYLWEKEYNETKELEDLCTLKDKVNLKLELEYKLNLNKDIKIGLNKVNEFLYYIDETLVAYLGISSFSGNVAELNGVSHPELRRKGIFKKLFDLAIEECKKRNFDKILLLSDDNSDSGIRFIEAMGGNYEFTEYRMKLFSNNSILGGKNTINLRKANNSDDKEIRRQNAIYFNGVEDSESFQDEDAKENEISISEEESLNKFTYMVELEKEVIGKIKIDYSDDLAFIYGFGILPKFRGKGYGKEALIEALRLIDEKNIEDVQLDVEGKNDAALNLYKSCGFQKQSAMNYYSYKI